MGTLKLNNNYMQMFSKEYIEKEIKLEVNKHYQHKSILYVLFEDDPYSKRIETGEMWSISTPSLVGSTERGDKLCTINFTDNTAICIRLKPEDYLSKRVEIFTEIKISNNRKGFMQSFDREIDLEKVLETMIFTLKTGKRKENPSLETLDYL